MLPPATPPLRSGTSHPGLLTSKDRITGEKKNGKKESEIIKLPSWTENSIYSCLRVGMLVYAGNHSTLPNQINIVTSNTLKTKRALK